MANLEGEFAELIVAADRKRFNDRVRQSPLSTVEARLHPLNFVAISTSDGAGAGLRLHLWDRRFRFGQTAFEVHDHSFDLESYVVQGDVEQTIYLSDPDPAGRYQPFHIQYIGNGSSMRASGERTTLLVTEQAKFEQGERYRLSHGVLHSLRPVSPSAVTLIFTRERGTAPITMGPHGGPRKMTSSRRALRGKDGAALSLANSSLDEIVEAAIAVTPEPSASSDNL
jgi:hypothetical protein